MPWYASALPVVRYCGASRVKLGRIAPKRFDDMGQIMAGLIKGMKEVANAREEATTAFTEVVGGRALEPLLDFEPDQGQDHA